VRFAAIEQMGERLADLLCPLRRSGNVFAWFVQQWQQWAAEMSLDLAKASAATDDSGEAAAYERLIALGLARQNTDLVFLPTLNGERGVPTAAGSIHQLRMGNWSMGDISAALARGIIDNLFGMIPPELQATIPIQRCVPSFDVLVSCCNVDHDEGGRLTTRLLLRPQDDRYGQRTRAQRAAAALPGAQAGAARDSAGHPNGRGRRGRRGAHAIAPVLEVAASFADPVPL
jgi:hypothetical protein